MNDNITLYELSAIGYSKYSMSSDGTLYYNFPSPTAIKQDKNNRFTITNDEEKKKIISLKKLYRLSFNKEFCIDNIANLYNE